MSLASLARLSPNPAGDFWGGLAAIHVCANTDWSLILNSAVDIVNFDAYAYTESIGLYATVLSAFLKRGGTLAWGLVPSLHQERRPDAEALHRIQTANALLEVGLRDAARREAERAVALEPKSPAAQSRPIPQHGY